MQPQYTQTPHPGGMSQGPSAAQALQQGQQIGQGIMDLMQAYKDKDKRKRKRKLVHEIVMGRGTEQHLRELADLGFMTEAVQLMQFDGHFKQAESDAERAELARIGGDAARIGTAFFSSLLSVPEEQRAQPFQQRLTQLAESEWGQTEAGAGTIATIMSMAQGAGEAGLSDHALRTYTMILAGFGEDMENQMELLDMQAKRSGAEHRYSAEAEAREDKARHSAAAASGAHQSRMELQRLKGAQELEQIDRRAELRDGTDGGIPLGDETDATLQDVQALLGLDNNEDPNAGDGEGGGVMSRADAGMADAGTEWVEDYAKNLHAQEAKAIREGNARVRRVNGTWMLQTKRGRGRWRTVRSIEEPAK